MNILVWRHHWTQWASCFVLLIYKYHNKFFCLAFLFFKRTFYTFMPGPSPFLTNFWWSQSPKTWFEVVKNWQNRISCVFFLKFGSQFARASLAVSMRTARAATSQKGMSWCLNDFLWIFLRLQQWNLFLPLKRRQFGRRERSEGGGYTHATALHAHIPSSKVDDASSNGHILVSQNPSVSGSDMFLYSVTGDQSRGQII